MLAAVFVLQHNAVTHCILMRSLIVATAIPKSRRLFGEYSVCSILQARPGLLSGCPFMTTFDLPDADYTAARAAFVQMKDDAWKKVDEIKKDLGEKWDEVTGTKK